MTSPVTKVAWFELDAGTLEFFPPAESWLVNSNFPRASRMQGHTQTNFWVHFRVPYHLNSNFAECNPRVLYNKLDNARRCASTFVLITFRRHFFIYHWTHAWQHRMYAQIFRKLRKCEIENNSKSVLQILILLCMNVNSEPISYSWNFEVGSHG